MLDKLRKFIAVDEGTTPLPRYVVTYITRDSVVHTLWFVRVDTAYTAYAVLVNDPTVEQCAIAKIRKFYVA